MLEWLLWKAPDVTPTSLGLVGRVSVYRNWGKQQVWFDPLGLFRVMRARRTSSHETASAARWWGVCLESGRSGDWTALTLVESQQSLKKKKKKKKMLQWLRWKASGVIETAQGPVGPVSIYCDRVKHQVWFDPLDLFRVTCALTLSGEVNSPELPSTNQALWSANLC